jgi:hypothetical protein
MIDKVAIKREAEIIKKLPWSYTRLLPCRSGIRSTIEYPTLFIPRTREYINTIKDLISEEDYNYLMKDVREDKKSKKIRGCEK